MRKQYVVVSPAGTSHEVKAEGVEEQETRYRFFIVVGDTRYTVASVPLDWGVFATGLRSYMAGEEADMQ